MRKICFVSALLITAFAYGQSSNSGNIIPSWSSASPSDSIRHLVLKINLHSIQTELDSMNIVITDADQGTRYSSIVPASTFTFQNSNMASIELNSVYSGFFRYDINVYRQGKPVLILSKDKTN